MREREREHERNDAPGEAPATDPGSTARLAGLRAAGMELLRAGDEAIDKVLSGNSERFLQSSRQEGGQ